MSMISTGIIEFVCKASCLTGQHEYNKKGNEGRAEVVVVYLRYVR